MNEKSVPREICFIRETRKEDMKNFLVQQLSTVSDKSSAGILGCLANGINIKYECWDGMEVKALLPEQVQFLKSVIEKLMGSMTLKCDYDGNQKCREYVQR